jgi:hypothetical protein
MSEVERGCGRRLHAQYYQIALSALNYVYLRGGDEILRGLELSIWSGLIYIESGYAWAVEQVGSNDMATELCIAYPAVSAHLPELRHHPHKQIQWLEAMLSSARRLNRRNAEGQVPDIVVVVENCATLMRKLNRESEAAKLEARAK